MPTKVSSSQQRYYFDDEGNGTKHAFVKSLCPAGMSGMQFQRGKTTLSHKCYIVISQFGD